MARRRRFHRTAPDRGWIVGQGGPTAISSSGEDNETAYFTLFDFADIDPEALTGRIEQDKSDWFIKRVLLTINARARLDGLEENDVARLFQWGVGTIGVENAAELESGAGHPVFGPEAYNLWSRLFQTGVMPAYHLPVTPLAYSEATELYGVGTMRSGVLSDAPIHAGWMLNFGIWGSAHQSFDFTVSNAGLRNNQECGVAITLCRGAGSNWDSGDILDLTWFYQVLVQKRRT